MRRSDPIQGILFNTKPVLLQQRAVARRIRIAGMDVTHPTFFEKIQAAKPNAPRLSRRRTSSLDHSVMRYEAYSPIKITFKKSS